MNKVVNKMEKLQMSVGILFLAIFFVVIIIQIVTRHLGISVIWTVEVATNTFIWSIMMGAAVMVNRRDHFSFDIFERKLKGKKRASLNILNDTILIFFNVAILIYSMQVTIQFWDYNWTSLPSLKKGYVWISVPIMSFTMIIYSLSHIINNIRNFNRKGE